MDEFNCISLFCVSYSSGGQQTPGYEQSSYSQQQQSGYPSQQGGYGQQSSYSQQGGYQQQAPPPQQPPPSSYPPPSGSYGQPPASQYGQQGSSGGAYGQNDYKPPSQYCRVGDTWHWHQRKSAAAMKPNLCDWLFCCLFVQVITGRTIRMAVTPSPVDMVVEWEGGTTEGVAEGGSTGAWWEEECVGEWTVEAWGKFVCVHVCHDHFLSFIQELWTAIKGLRAMLNTPLTLSPLWWSSGLCAGTTKM